MMKNIFKLLILCGLCLGLQTACVREKVDLDTEEPSIPEILDKGSINLDSVNVNVVQTKTTTDLSNFIVNIFNEDRSVDKEWIYSEMPELFELLVGDYTIVIYSHVQQAAEFDKPYYVGEKFFTIVKDEITYLGQLVCGLKSVMITVKLDEHLASKAEEYSVVIKVNDGSLTYTSEDIESGRAGYFISIENENVVVASFKGVVDGEPVVTRTAYVDVITGEHRIIEYSINSSDPELGDIGELENLTLALDVSMTIVGKDIIIDPGKEEIMPDDGGNGEGGDPTPSGVPTIEGIGFNIDEVIEFPAGETVTVQVKIKAENRINNLFVTIDSDKLSEDLLVDVGLAKSFDLAYPDDLLEGLSGLGFPVGDEVIGSDEILFDITGFTPLLGIYGAGTHNFIIKVIDQSNPVNETTKTLTLITTE